MSMSMHILLNSRQSLFPRLSEHQLTTPCETIKKKKQKIKKHLIMSNKLQSPINWNTRTIQLNQITQTHKWQLTLKNTTP